MARPQYRWRLPSSLLAGTTIPAAGSSATAFPSVLYAGRFDRTGPSSTAHSHRGVSTGGNRPRSLPFLHYALILHLLRRRAASLRQRTAPRVITSLPERPSSARLYPRSHAAAEQILAIAFSAWQSTRSRAILVLAQCLSEQLILSTCRLPSAIFLRCSIRLGHRNGVCPQRPVTAT